MPRPNPSEQGGELNVPVVVANVNAQCVTREGLARECLREYGNDVLDSMVNRELIVQECQRRNLVVTAKEVDAEIDRLAQHFRFPVDQWLKLLQQEKGITPRQYAQHHLARTGPAEVGRRTAPSDPRRKNEGI